MSIIGIVAVAKNNAIGKAGKLPWHYSSDLRFFKRTTLNNAVIMGSNTWHAIGKPLPDRLNLVLSRKNGVETGPNVVVLRNRGQALTLAGYLDCDLFVIGGAKTYECFSDVIEKWIVTEVPLEVGDADAFMPDDYLEGFDLFMTETMSDGLVIRTYERGSER